MTIWFVTRHPGAIEWASRQGLKIDRQVAHLEVAEVQAGDVVIGILPVNLAAEICTSGGRYLHLTIDTPEEMRGRELSAEQLIFFNARIEEYIVRRR